MRYLFTLIFHKRRNCPYRSCCRSIHSSTIQHIVHCYWRCLAGHFPISGLSVVHLTSSKTHHAPPNRFRIARRHHFSHLNSEEQIFEINLNTFVVVCNLPVSLICLNNWTCSSIELMLAKCIPFIRQKRAALYQFVCE